MSPDEIERGLMHVEHMPEDEGMLFKFKRAAVLNFWGKNTYIPLDIAFISEDGMIRHIANIEPMSLKGVSSMKPCHMALEMNRGFFRDNRIKVGTRIAIDYKSPSRRSALIPQADSNPDIAYLTFSTAAEIVEGKRVPVEKELIASGRRLKLSQMLNDLNLQSVPEVGKPGEETIGDPINSAPPTQVDDPSLPVFSSQEIGAKLEDAFDPEETNEIEQKEIEDQESPPEEETPEEEMPVFDNPFQASDWAEHNNQVMRIGYTTAHGRQITREVEPHGQFHSESTKRQILVTYDRTIGDIRAFILSNIGQWSFTGREFQKKFTVKG
jgi:uncharacterized membrane protein (UPF0127 family)